MTPPTITIRLRPDDESAIAALSAGDRTRAIREAVHQWERATHEAREANATEISRDDWHRLAHLNDVADMADVLDEDHGIDWSRRLAMELVGMWEGRPMALSAHKSEARECGRLALQIAAMGRVRGWAIMDTLRRFWRTEDAPAKWWEADAWDVGPDVTAEG